MAFQTHDTRPWVLPDACPGVQQREKAASELDAAIERATRALDQGSLGKLIHALLGVRALLRSRLAENHKYGVRTDEAVSIGPWKRRLRRRYAASLCSVDRLLDEAWASGDGEALRASIQEELRRLRRIDSLEIRAQLEGHWMDLGVGD